ncbi:MAG: type IV secretion system DNA-binding domain-containing protein [Hyphomicrobium sp.]|uniref:type IV secretory system conjugative DNA transfer family protein n=1 Tax=Hyphomicrobium sp. TaxID=82 RepID=UPI00132C5842|nr:type IV secretory system conjugative DNA transfer family protein [Hyphomicrobium sp.]KAB2938284.1 MAG: type IV secretory system conjugative DNA transfer family protein [Hyphomicrobium sp.]MBZ0211263.1 type IV secretion system DNA-binding domain-containing protein [Hyphomicrobium sp.]
MVDDSIDDADHIELGTHPDGSWARLGRNDRRRHIYLIGKTGTGKSTLLLNLMLADLERGHGFALIDPHGDLALAVAAATPAWRTNDVVYLDPSDLAHPVGFNPLYGVSVDHRPLVAAHIVAAFQHIWGSSWGPRLEYILTNSLRLLLDAPGSTLLGLPRLLADEGYRKRLLAHARDPVVRSFWQSEFAQYSDRYATEAIAPIQNKVGTLLSPPALRNMLGQVRSTIDIRRIMDSGQVLIVNLAKGKLGETPAHLLGAFLSTAFAQAAEGRAELPEHARRDFTLYADEFQNFATDSFAAILSEARKYRLALVLAHQFLGQLSPLLRQAVIGNAGSILAFRIGAEDAPLIAAELGIESKSALTDTVNFALWAKLLRAGVPTDPRRIDTAPPADIAGGRFDAVRNRSRARSARPRAAVEAKIARFLSGA